MRYTIEPCRAVFTRRGYKVTLLNDDGTPYARRVRYAGTKCYAIDRDPVRFYGNDGRTVRAQAVAFARDMMGQA